MEMQQGLDFVYQAKQGQTESTLWYVPNTGNLYLNPLEPGKQCTLAQWQQAGWNIQR